MAGPFMNHRLACTLLVLATTVLCSAWAAAANILRWSQNIPGDSKPILLHADEITTWTEGSERVIVLKGAVYVEQGVLHGRMQGAVGWVDQQHTSRTGILHLDLYAEGDVRLEDGLKTQSVNKAFLDLNTRGELKLLSQRKKAIQQPVRNDPLYQRAVAERARVSSAGASALERTSAQETPPPAVASPNSPRLLPVQAPVVPVPSPAPSGAVPAVPNGPGVPGTSQHADPLLGPVAPTPAPYSGSSPTVVPVTPAPPAVPAAPSPQRPQVPAPGPPTPAAQAPARQFSIAPRRSVGGFQETTVTMPTGEQALIVTGGVILTVRNVENIGLLDIEGDQLVVWTRGNFQQLFNSLHGSHGRPTREVEFYLAGNVEIREQIGPESRILRAEEVYYDVSRNVAVAYQADLEFKQPGLPDPVHLRAEEIQQLSVGHFKGLRAEVFSSRLPSDPGLKIVVAQATLDEKKIPKHTIFGWQFVNRKTGQPETEQQRLFHGDDVVVRLEDYPIFYLPFIQGDANDPLGPLRDVRASYNRIFGFQALSTFNVYDLLGVDPIPGTRWDLDLDYLSARGPALGTNYDYAGDNLFGVPGRYNGLVKLYGIYDTGRDILGGNRGLADDHPKARGRALWRHREDLPEDFTLWLQLSALSDPNFLEQYYKDEFDRDINQETYIYLKQQRNDWAWTLWAEPRIRDWVTETERLPQLDGYLIGQSLLDIGGIPWLTYTAHASAGYDRLQTSDLPQPPVSVTDQADNTGRFDTWNELSLPFSLGPVRLVPYVVGDLTYYTQDLTGNDRGRVYGAAGWRASMPLSRIYPDIQSDLLNLNAINHKILFSANYYTSHSDTSFSRLPQLDRLNDDATDQALRDIRPLEPIFNPAHGLFLETSPLFDPQVYAIRRLVDDRIDTLDSVDVLQMDIRQRWQTKRGYPGMQHIVDWMTLDMSASYFPHANRDNFGESFAFLEYDWTWNVGDRTALVSTGWVDPIDNGPRVFTLGAFLNRPDQTNFYLGYRQIDPVSSRAVTAAITYVFSPKYAMTASSTFDFGTNLALDNSLVFTRMGSDLQLNIGITYNALLSNFGVVAEIIPNVVGANRRVPGMPAFGSGMLGR